MQEMSRFTRFESQKKLWILGSEPKKRNFQHWLQWPAHPSCRHAPQSGRGGGWARHRPPACAPAEPPTVHLPCWRHPPSQAPPKTTESLLRQSWESHPSAEKGQVHADRKHRRRRKQLLHLPELLSCPHCSNHLDKGTHTKARNNWYYAPFGFQPRWGKSCLCYTRGSKPLHRQSHDKNTL